MKKVLLALLVLALLGSAGAVLFERHERGGIVKRSERSCSGIDRPEAGAPSRLPLGIPLTGAETVLRVTTQGKTTIAYAKVPGTRDDIVSVREGILTDLRAVGYTVTGTDQEPGYEAEAELGGTHHGTLKVSPLCEGQLEIRYKIEQ